MIALYLLVGSALTAFEAWLAMLLIGGIHSNVPEVPTFNYEASLMLAFLVNILVGSAVIGKEAGKWEAAA